MIEAAKLPTTLDAENFPAPAAWNSAKAIVFCADWQGRNPEPRRQTEVRVLWSPTQLYLRFQARYLSLYTFPNGSQRQAELWNRDVAEAFIQAPDQSGHHYAEFEISPNGDWLDLKIDGHQTLDLQSAMKSRVLVDTASHIWTAELSIPISSLTTHFDPSQPWRANFFRIEGSDPDRYYSSWRPTNTPQPNFHVPEAFGTLKFVN